jgi:hypothetical protein
MARPVTERAASGPVDSERGALMSGETDPAVGGAALALPSGQRGTGQGADHLWDQPLVSRTSHGDYGARDAP